MRERIDFFFMRGLVSIFCMIAACAFTADDPPAPEPGERALDSRETDAALSGMAAAFKAHPFFRAKILSEIDDLAGTRTEAGDLLVARGDEKTPRVLRTFAKPALKAWLLNGAEISEYVASQHTIYIKDFSGASNTLRHIRAAMTGDIRALEEIFTIRAFLKASENGKPATLRLVLDKKAGVSRLVHRRIVARVAEGGLFFDEIRYIPDEGDEITEKFLEIKDTPEPSDAEFALPGGEGIARKVEKVAE